MARLWPLLATSVSVALTGCATRTVYLLADGRAPGSDPVLNQQFEMDRTVCNGDMQKANLSGVTFTGGGLAGAVAAANRGEAASQVGQGCMAERGYVLVREDQTAAKQQELAAIAAEKARREAAAAAPPPPAASSTRRTAAVAKPKAQPVSLTVPSQN
jgi:hypothetical protein